MIHPAVQFPTCSKDETEEHRSRPKRAREELRMILNGEEVWMIGKLENLHSLAFDVLARELGHRGKGGARGETWWPKLTGNVAGAPSCRWPQVPQFSLD